MPAVVQVEMWICGDCRTRRRYGFANRDNDYTPKWLQCAGACGRATLHQFVFDGKEHIRWVDYSRKAVGDRVGRHRDEST